MIEESMTRKEIEREAAVEILSFMQKHELEDEDMSILICYVLDLAEREDFVDIFVAYDGMDHIRDIANEEDDV